VRIQKAEVIQAIDKDTLKKAIDAFLAKEIERDDGHGHLIRESPHIGSVTQSEGDWKVREAGSDREVIEHRVTVVIIWD
jgi:hypothetical protein